MQYASRNCSRRRTPLRPGALPCLVTALCLAAAVVWGTGRTAPADDGPTAEARKPIADRFEALDTDKNGTLSPDEFAAAGDDAAQPLLARDFKVFDLDRDGRLTYDEFLNVPSLVPAALRGRLPDPLVELVNRALAKIDAAWKGWDANGDGELSAGEFRGSGLVKLVGGLEAASFDDWNRDGRGGVSRDDCRALLEVAFGVRRLTGEPLRYESGIVVNGMLFLQFDLNRDDRLELAEIVKMGFDGDQAEARFGIADADHDGSISFAEWTKYQLRWYDPISEFLRIDSDLDGRIDRGEYLNAAVHWQKELAWNVFPGFDQDRDGFLSLDEFRLTMLANLVVRWYEPRTDADGDGFLTLADFRWEPGLGLSALYAEYFRLLDLNHDGRLDQDEFSFHTIRRDPKREFRKFDADSDGSLNESEIGAFAGDKPRVDRLLRLLDLNRDGQLSYDEFLTVPGLFSPKFRGRFPDPIVKLVDAQMAVIEDRWSGWDKNADKILSRGEFQASGLARFVPGLALSMWQDWDRDGNGSISREECRGLLEIAFGVRRLTGEPLRFDSGIIINAMLFGQIDANNDDRLSFEEFEKTGFEGKEAKPRFRDADVDGDAILSFAEFATMQYRWIDPLADFMRIDTDLDGRIDRAELLQASPDWQQPVARHLFPGFDLDRDGFLSLDEYRRLPFVNLLVRWYEPRRDSDNDGLLSRGDFQWSKRPALASLEAEYFRCFDLNQDDVLDLTEFDFQIDPVKGPRELVFRQRDRDGDEKLSFDEVLGDFRLPTSAKPDAAYELRLGRIEEAFRKADADHDGFLTLDEFRTEAGLEAISPEAAAIRTTSTAVTTGLSVSAAAEGERRRMWIIIGGNAALLLGVLAYVLFKK